MRGAGRALRARRSRLRIHLEVLESPGTQSAMGGNDLSEDDEDYSRRFDLDLWIVHPTMKA